MAAELISLTKKNTDGTTTALKLANSQIVSFYGVNSGADSYLTYITSDGVTEAMTVDEAPATINAAAKTTFAVTDSVSGSTFYVNANLVSLLTVNGSGSNIIYNDIKGATYAKFTVTESNSAIQTTMNALTTAPSFSDITVADPINYSSATGITAFAGGGQASATQLTEEHSNVTTVATAADSVKLPTAEAGILLVVENNGANSMDVFPATGGTINGGAANAAIKVPAGARKYFMAISATAWLTGTRTSQGKGTLALPAITFDDQPNMGLYWISATQMGVGIAGNLAAMFDTAGILLTELKERVAGVGIAVTGNLIEGGSQVLTGPGAVNVTHRNTLLITTGADALTLADGQEGQHKFIKMNTDGGDGTLTVANLQGGTTITFNDAGDFVELYFLDGKWNIIANSGCTVA